MQGKLARTSMVFVQLFGGLVEMCGGIFVVTMICDRVRDAGLLAMQGTVPHSEKLTSFRPYLSVYNFWWPCLWTNCSFYDFSSLELIFILHIKRKKF